MSNNIADNSIFPPVWSVIEFTFSDSDSNAELVVMCNHKRYVVHATEDNFASSPELKQKYLFFLKVAEEYEVDGFTVDDFYDWALEPLLPVLNEQNHEPEAETATLHDCLYAPILEYTLEAESNQLVLRPREGHAETHLMFGVCLPDGKCQSWPCYLPSEIQLDGDASYDSIPHKVILPDGTIAFFKLMGCGEGRTLERELNSYGRIRASGLPNSARISRLLGLVREKSGTVFGLLLTYIDCKAQTLTCAVESGASESLRRQWVAEISQTVSHLHQEELLWGDAKPDNVLIDENKNAWLVDFGCGYTEGWVPETLANTIEGDITGLANIVDYIKGKSIGSMIRSRTNPSATPRPLSSVVSWSLPLAVLASTSAATLPRAPPRAPSRLPTAVCLGSLNMAASTSTTLATTPTPSPEMLLVP